MADIDHVKTPDITLNSVFCLAESASTLGYDMTSTNSSERDRYKSLPSNCGLGILNLSVTNGDSTLN